jgi:N-acetylglucosaminyl-diphospho-decaprenol L-rhamnosyltransferase
VPDVTIIVVNWNVRDLLRKCLLSLCHADRRAENLPRASGHDPLSSAAPESHIESQIIVVDNASSDGSAAMVKQQFPTVHLIENSDNVGFGAANNQALRLATGAFILFLNPDTEVRPGAVRSLLDFLQERPQVACVGPKLLYADGTTQSSRRSFPSLGTAFVESTILQRYLGWLPSLRAFYRSDDSDDEPRQVDWLVGACLLVRRAALDEVGAFDERFFMYSEEMDLCYRLSSAGYQTWFVPQAEVLHYEAASSSQDLFRRDVHFHESRYRFFRKHHGVLSALALRWFVFGTFVFQLGEEAAKFVLQPAKRDLRRERLNRYSRIVKWYLFAS